MTESAQNKGGAPKGNRNAMTNGKASVFTTGSWPAGSTYIASLARKMRVQIEDAVVARHGEIKEYHSNLINAACRHETAALLVQRWIRKGELTVDQRLNHLKEFRSATDARSRALRELDLHTPSDDLVPIPDWSVPEDTTPHIIEHEPTQSSPAPPQHHSSDAVAPESKEQNK